MCVTTNTYSELETTVCSSDGAWQRRNNKSIDHYETITNSSVGSSLKPINTLVFCDIHLINTLAFKDETFPLVFFSNVLMSSHNLFGYIFEEMSKFSACAF